jgi:hypothetical protein
VRPHRFTAACLVLAGLSLAWFVWAVVALEGVLTAVQWG